MWWGFVMRYYELKEGHDQSDQVVTRSNPRDVLIPVLLTN